MKVVSAQTVMDKIDMKKKDSWIGRQIDMNIIGEYEQDR